MQPSDGIKEYLEVIRQQIRWKKAQPIVLEEIENHITDQKEAFLREGFDEEMATARAIAEMGDPVMVGGQLDRVHRPKPDWWLLILTSFMLLLGLVIQYELIPRDDDMLSVERQIVWAGIAVLAFLLAYFADFTLIGRHPISLFLGLGALVIGGHLIQAIQYGPMLTVFPLLLFPVIFAGLVYIMRNKGLGGMFLCGAAFLVAAIMASLATGGWNSWTVLFLLCVSCFAIFIYAIAKGWFLVRKIVALPISIIGVLTIAVLSTRFFLLLHIGYILDRIRMALNPSIDSGGVVYSGSYILRDLSKAQFFGSGLPLEEYGASVTPDFLLTYLIERYGWIVLVGCLALFGVFFVRGVLLSQRQASVLGKLVSLAVMMTVGGQCVVYVVANLGFLLLAPLALPLFSYGGLAMVINMILVGLLLSVFRTGSLVKDKPVRKESVNAVY